jgi:hypothetical protein
LEPHSLKARTSIIENPLDPEPPAHQDWEQLERMATPRRLRLLLGFAIGMLLFAAAVELMVPVIARFLL